MNKLVTHYRNSTQLKKEDLSKAEKQEIISTLNLLKKCESLAPEEREEEFDTICFNFGLDDDQTKAAKEIFLGIEPSEIWEKNILALERGEWVESMQTKCFKRWNKQRPSILTTLEFIFQCKIPAVPCQPEVVKVIAENKLKDSMGDERGTISDGIVGQIAKWINDEADEAEAKIRRGDSARDIAKRGRAQSTPSLCKRNSPPSFPPTILPLPLPSSQVAENEDKTKKGKKKEASRTKSKAQLGSTSTTSPPSTPRKSQDEETERKAEMKRKKSKRHQSRENPSRAQEESNEGEKRRLNWVRKLSVDRDIGRKKENGEKINWKRRGSVDSLTGTVITVSFSDGWDKDEERRGRSESDSEFRQKRPTKEESGKREKENSGGKKEKEEIKKEEIKKDKKERKVAPLLCWMGSSENLRAVDENTSPSEFSRAMLSRSRDSPTEEKRREQENKAKTIEVYQSFKM